MIEFVARRLAHALAVLLGVSMVVFVVLRLSGNPAALLLPLDASQADYTRLVHAMGLDQPLVVQYLRFLQALVRGDFGVSLRVQQPALQLALERLPATSELALAALVLAVAGGFPLGMWAALRHNRAGDRIGMTLSLLGQSTPVFWLGLMLILIFSVTLRWFPTSGYGGTAHLVLPAVTLAMYSMGRLARMVRSGLLEVLGEDYIRTARAKGLGPVRVMVTHATRNVLIPIVTVLGLDLAALLGGAVVTETVFAWPGIGRLAVQSIQTRDYPVVQAAVAITAAIYVGINLFVDVLYAVLDPKLRLG